MFICCSFSSFISLGDSFLSYFLPFASFKYTQEIKIYLFSMCWNMAEIKQFYTVRSNRGYFHFYLKWSQIVCGDDFYYIIVKNIFDKIYDLFMGLTWLSCSLIYELSCTIIQKKRSKLI